MSDEPKTARRDPLRNIRPYFRSLQEPAPEPKTAQEHMTEMAKEPSLNEFFMRNPKDITDADLSRLVAHNRDDRALFISKGETTRKEKDDE